MSQVNRDGVLLHVEDSGGTGLPVLFQHGLCGDAGQTREAFPDDTLLRRITLECRGHGQSEAGDTARFSIKTFADDVAALIEASRLAPLVIGGISMGAAIALQLAVRRPELVRGLILARPAWVTEAAPANMQPNAEVGRLLATMTPGAAQSTFLVSKTALQLAEIAPDNLVSLTAFFGREPLAVTAALLQQISADGPGVTEQDVRAIRVPALVIGTVRDAIHPLSHAQALADLIPGASLAQITAKADNRSRFVAEFQSTLSTFLKDFL
jgi:pimeloyl-ACP methyl ester carboxylesterase